MPGPTLCESILLVPGESTLLTATASNADQCTTQASLLVEVADESAFALDTVFTCANEPVWIDALFTADPGVYCDTLVLPSGCRQIHCTELMVGDTISQQLSETICPGDSVTVGGQWFSLPGTYPVSLSTAAGCDSTLMLELAWWEVPVYSLLPTDTTIFEGNVVELTLTGPGASISWEPTQSLDCATCATVFATPQESIVYQVLIIDENGCTQTLETMVHVRIDCDPGRVQIPTAFTPDGDGVNDTFGILTVAGREKVLEMQVWNRWGQTVFESTDPQARWQGDHRGKPAPSDVYAYRIVVGCADGFLEVYTGEVTLLR
ncbi:MAG: gliding motility-associated C-terminal domain-containing protein [Saprospirales bacterium]|nr:gliding motility-associated C-terminal domain-containing protein [Saprospirales bacterium]